jgi:TMEM175 potassium channel family protein
VPVGLPGLSPVPRDRQPVDEGELPGIDRLLALSDGVVAIALTLLVLQLRVPVLSALHHPNSASRLADRLGQEGNQFFRYLIAFYVIAQFWLAHHRAYRLMVGHTEGLAWWNFAFLLTITLMPFTSDLLGQYGSNPLAIVIFSLNLLLANIASVGTMLYAEHAGLLSSDADRRVIWMGRVRSASATVAVLLAMGVAWFSTSAAKYCWLLIAIGPIAVHRWPGRLARDSSR